MLNDVMRAVWGTERPRPSREVQLRTSLGSSALIRQDPAVWSNPLDFHLLTAKLVFDRLHVVGSDLLEGYFLDDACGFVHQRMLGGFDDLDLVVCPIDVADILRIRDGTAQHLGMLIV
jgi:hypothetical protein